MINKTTETMGKGDKKTKRGKIFISSYGKLRPKREKFKTKPRNIKGALKTN